MLAQDGGGSLLEFESLGHRLLGLGTELPQLVPLRLGQPAWIHLAEFAERLAGVEQYQRVGCRLHVPPRGCPEPLLPPDRAVEVQHGAPAQLSGDQSKERRGRRVDGQGKEALVMIGAGEELDAGRQFLGPVRSLGVAGPYAFDEFLPLLAVRLVGKPPGTVEIEIVEGFPESLDRIRVPW